MPNSASFIQKLRMSFKEGADLTKIMEPSLCPSWHEGEGREISDRSEILGRKEEKNTLCIKTLPVTGIMVPI